MPALTDSPEEEVAAEIEEAKSNFELQETLSGVARRTKTIELFTDEVTGEKHLDNEQKLEACNLILKAAEAEGLTITDEMRETLALTEAEAHRIEKEQPSLAAELHKTSLVFELRATPRIVKEAAQRYSYKATNTAAGNIPPDKIIPFNQAYSAYIISKMVMGYTNNVTGNRFTSMTVHDAQHLREFLPESQYARLEALVTDLQDRNMISEAVTASADFSQAG